MELIQSLRDPRAAATPAELARLDELVDQVPADLADFLDESNGGEVEIGDLVVSTPWGPRHIVLTEFWPATAQTPAGGSIEKATRALRREGMLPATVLAIASDIESNCLCISAEPETLGHIYLWDDTRSHPELEQRETLSDFIDFIAPVATSLNELAGLLTDEATATTQLAKIDPVKEPPPPQPQQWRSRPVWVSPGELTETTATHQTYVYRHVGSQPDVVLAKPLAAVRDNSGESLAGTWESPTVTWHRPDTNRFDLIDANGLLLLRTRAVDAIAPLLEPYGELLRCNTATEPLFVFRCLNLIEALDPNVELVTGKNGFVDLSAVDLIAGRVADAGVFTLPQQPRSPRVFFTRPIVEEILDADIRTLDFTLVWEGD